MSKKLRYGNKKRNIKINQSVINQNVMQILKNYIIDQKIKSKRIYFQKVDTKEME